MVEPRIGVLMGSDSDLDVMEDCLGVLKSFRVAFEVNVMSAHRTPALVHDYVTTARTRGLKVIICAAGGAAHLAGVVASLTTLPVIGVPMDATGLGGLDALLSTVQMPPGVPVATVGVGRFGATNSALLALEILAASDNALASELQTHRASMADSVSKKNARANERLKDKGLIDV
ncbi:MAG: 5-(carboxyamino)imidazole ribonucleotide mutase [Planctomycetota bacterium]